MVHALQKQATRECGSRGPMADTWLNHVLGPTDPQGPQALWLPRSQDHLAQKHRSKPFELV